MFFVPNEQRFETYKDISYAECSKLLMEKYGKLIVREDRKNLTIYFIKKEQVIGEYNQASQTLYLYEKDTIKETNIRSSWIWGKKQ